MYITQFALKYQRFTQVFLFLLLVIGIKTFFNSPSKEDPEILIRSAIVTAQYPGMSPDRIEKFITIPLEREIKQMPEVNEINSWSKNGVSQITVSVHDKYFDLQPIWDSLRTRVESVKHTLPSGTSGPYVNDDFGQLYSATIALTGEGFSSRELRKEAEKIQDQLSSLRTVSQVELYGVNYDRVWIKIKDGALENDKYQFRQIISAIQSRNVLLSGGKVDVNGLEVALEPTGNFNDLEDILNFEIFERESNNTLYLRDLATVEFGYEEPFNTPVYYNGKPAVVIATAMALGERSDYFGKEVQQYLSEARIELPIGMTLDLATFQPEKVEVAVSSATNNLLQTIAVVLTVVMLFLGFRMGIIVGCIVPLTILLAIVGMSLWGVDLQRMSIAAVIISLGLLVDNGIVIAEFIQTKIAEGQERVSAAIDAAKSMAIPLLTSSLTTILAFMPLLLAQDVTGEYLRSLSQVITLSLLSSWFLCLFATPALCVWFLKQPIKQKEKRNQIAVYIWYRKLLTTLLGKPFLTLTFVGVCFFAAIYAFKFVTVQFMPGSERNQYLVFVDLPSGTGIEQSQQVSQRLEHWLLDGTQNPDVTSVVRYVGDGGPRFFLALSPIERSPNRVFMVVNTTDYQSAIHMVSKTNQFIVQSLPEATGQAKQMWLGGTELGLVEYQVVGPDINSIKDVAKEIEILLRKTPGTVGVTNDWENNVPKMIVNIDQTNAMRTGVTSRDIASSLDGFLRGHEISSYRQGEDVIPVMISATSHQKELESLFTKPIISSGSGNSYSLAQFADVKTKSEVSVIRRFDLQRTVTVSVKHQYLQASELNKEVSDRINQIALPPNTKILLGGELKGASKANGALFGYLPQCFAVMVLLLVLQFNSIRRPAIILMTIPFSLIGAVLGLLIMDAYFTFPAMLGLFSLAGIIINNGIVLIDCIEHYRQKGASEGESIISACVDRLRPIVMTTLTTILGLVPLALYGGEFWYSMAIVLIFGMAVGTLLTLFVVPVFYRVLFRVHI
ncbi:AcrB/AcrD/AcrF family protein [Vibrio rotiferianus]|uniref:efflux RND transporter permease subunit n=1 Tax=Vibrio rotiferianus TaxID=190895 RepID=UPI001110C8AB|nr:efflux RND transporter permease subunit [Vibrio rotiferianus]TMX31412.1 AcrB/AcrD/AcrF family protein [Vibrio rotiferianus]TMX42987.1 AcrB/AcrD/AcrF family protein [Vibrio rotiferianus]TMX60097.1 AcrB/AcrD/AcrF family protein [Vibrio rotiferianus]